MRVAREHPVNSTGTADTARIHTGTADDVEEEDDADFPAFLLPFIEEHVCAVESQEAKQEAKAQEDATWTHVSGKRASQTGERKLIDACSASPVWQSAMHIDVVLGAAM